MIDNDTSREAIFCRVYFDDFQSCKRLKKRWGKACYKYKYVFITERKDLMKATELMRDVSKKKVIFTSVVLSNFI